MYNTQQRDVFAYAVKAPFKSDTLFQPSEMTTVFENGNIKLALSKKLTLPTKIKIMGDLKDLYLKEQGGPNGGFVYEVNLTKEQVVKLAEILGCLKDTSPSIPEEAPAYSTNNESILIETGFGISFQAEQRKDVDEALESMGFDLYNADPDRSWT